MKKPLFLLTGGTGFLGRFLLEKLQKWSDVDVLSRNNSASIQGDLSSWNAGLDLQSLQKLKEKKYSALIHLAGLYDLKASRDSLLMNNVIASSNALRLAEQLSIPLFVNASSIVAASNFRLFFDHQKKISAYDLNLTHPFPDPYAESKALGEQLLQNSHIPFKLNLRYGILVGNSVDGKILRLDGPYTTPETFKQLQHLLNRCGNFILLPGNEHVRLPLVPVDYAASATSELIRWKISTIEKIIEKKRHASKKVFPDYQSFHLIPKQGLSVRHLYQSTLNHLSVNKSLSFLLVDKLPDSLIHFASEKLFSFPSELLKYALRLPRLEIDEKLETILGQDWCPEFPEYESIFWSGYDKYISNR